MNIDNAKIAIIGLGYVGLPLAVEFGRHRPVVGFDINQTRIAELKAGQDNTLEVSAADLAAAGHLEFSADTATLAACDIFIVTVPTPIDKVNRPDLTPLQRASETVGKALRPGAIVVYESTVFPGCTEEVCVPLLEKHSGLVFNRDFFCGYSPERINPGDKSTRSPKSRKPRAGRPPKWRMRSTSFMRASFQRARSRRRALGWPKPPRSSKIHNAT
jgi:UDP-N-acetyl-D-glucosamine/UDP-N-acetyl-D-galactosamine dehydrogenase